MSSLLSSSKIFLIVIILDLAHFLVSSNGTGAIWIISPVLFQLKRFLIYSGYQFVQNPLDVWNWWLICWRLLLSGLRSVLGNATDGFKPLRLTIRFTLGTWFQATERLVRSLPGCTSSSSRREFSINVDRFSIISRYQTYLLYLTHQAYPEIRHHDVHRLRAVACCIPYPRTCSQTNRLLEVFFFSLVLYLFLWAIALRGIYESSFFLQNNVTMC